MSKAKFYFTMMPLLLVIGIILLIYLPENQRYYVFLIPILYWILYYFNMWIEKKRKQK
ncbi:MAG TPA: hypothetical protein VKZ77_14035 [Bacillaceae bacterium]|nr:hypothetical protein [Paenibacillus bovis]HLU23579.1 hypothetical protein [Bacillaceae bacterium]